MKVPTLLIATLVLMAFRAETAVTITPAAPTSQEFVTAVIDVTGGCGDLVSTSVIGNSIRTDILEVGCILGPPSFTVPQTVRFGPLAPGTYVYDVYMNYEHTGPVLDSRHAIVVAPAALPGLSSLGLSILAVSLAVIACFLLGKRG